MPKSADRKLHAIAERAFAARIIQFSCLLWFFRPFSVVELASAFRLFKNVPHY